MSNITAPQVSSFKDQVSTTSLAAAIAHAQSLKPTEDHPVLIQLGPGSYTLDSVNSLPTTNLVTSSNWLRGNQFTWRLRLRHIYFAGAGYEFTRIVCDRIVVDPDAITGFRDLQLDAVVELGDSFLPVHNVQVREVEMRNGQLDGLWRDAAGAVHLSRFSAETLECGSAAAAFSSGSAAPAPQTLVAADTFTPLLSNLFLLTNQLLRLTTHPLTTPLPTCPSTQLLSAPDPDATNTFVLKSGDTMTGPLRIERYYPAEKLVLSPLAGSSNIIADFRIESMEGTNFGFHIMFRRTSNEAYRTADGIWFWSNERRVLGIQSTYVTVNYLPIKHVWPVSDPYDAANKWYVDTQIGTRVSSVNAGDGLSGGGGPGAVTLHVNAGDGIAIVADTVTADSSLLRTGTAAQTYLTIANGTTRAMLHGATNALDLLVSTNYLPALSNWAIGYVDGVLTNGQSIVVFISTNQLQVISNNFYFYGDLVLLSNQIWGLGWPLSNDNAATKLYVDTQDAAQFASATNASAAYADARFLKLAGGMLTGDVFLAGGAALRAAVSGSGKHAVLASRASASGKFVTATNLVEAYADDPFGGAAVVKLYPHISRANGDAYIDASGAQIRNLAAPTAVSHAVTKGYVDQVASNIALMPGPPGPTGPPGPPGPAAPTNLFLVKTGDMMLGDLRFTNNCRIAAEVRGGSSSHSSLASVAGIAGGYYTAATNLIVAYATNGYSGTAVIKLHPFATGVNTSNAFVDMSGAPVRNVGTPGLPSDAATKNYVDTKQFGTANISNNAVTADKLANGAVTSAKLAQMGATSNQVLKWNGNAWVPATDFGDTNSISRPEADDRYVNASGDSMSGALTAPELYATGSQNWRVGSAAQPNVDIELLGANSKITTGNGKRLILAPRGALIQCETNTAVNGSLAVAGSVTAARGISSAGPLALAAPWAGMFATTSSGSTTVSVPGMTANAIVVVTPRGSSAPANTANYAYRVNARQNEFVVYYNRDCYNMAFNYIVIQP